LIIQVYLHFLPRENIAVIHWTHIASTILAAFMGSLVEFVEALTLILAVGISRGWRSSLGGAKRAFDPLSFTVSFKAFLIEGVEVVFIVVAAGAADSSFMPARLGAAVALTLVVGLGLIVHEPLTRVPENSVKFGVGVTLMAFGLFWLGEGSGLDWLGGDLAIPALILLILAAALLVASSLKKRAASSPQ
jgi:uncharacterized membrane protein